MGATGVWQAGYSMGRVTSEVWKLCGSMPPVFLDSLTVGAWGRWTGLEIQKLAPGFSQLLSWCLWRSSKRRHLESIARLSEHLSRDPLSIFCIDFWSCKRRGNRKKNGVEEEESWRRTKGGEGNREYLKTVHCGILVSCNCNECIASFQRIWSFCVSVSQQNTRS